MKCSGRSVAAASRVIEIDEVLVARIASGFSSGQRSAKILRLTSSFSVADSITRSQSPSSSSVSAGVMRASAALRSSSVISLRETCRAMLPLMVASPALMRSRRDVVEQHVEAGERADMRDAVAHLAGADHADLAIVDAIFSARSLVRAAGRSLTSVMLP